MSLARRADRDGPQLYELIAIFISSQQFVLKDIINMSMLSKQANLFFDKFFISPLLENLDRLNDKDYESLLIFLENMLAVKSVKAEQIFIGLQQAIGWSKDVPHGLALLNRLLLAMQRSGYLDEKRLNMILRNAINFGNFKLIHVLLKNKLATIDAEMKQLIICNAKHVKAHRYLITYETVICFELEKILNKFKNEIKSYNFILNGGGDSSVDEIGHPIPIHAANVYRLVNAALEGDLIRTYDKLVEDVIIELRPAVDGWLLKLGLFSTYSKRTNATEECYENLKQIIKEGLIVLYEYNELFKLVQREPLSDEEIEALSIEENKPLADEASGFSNNY